MINLASVWFPLHDIKKSRSEMLLHLVVRVNVQKRTWPNFMAVILCGVTLYLYIYRNFLIHHFRLIFSQSQHYILCRTITIINCIMGLLSYQYQFWDNYQYQHYILILYCMELLPLCLLFFIHSSYELRYFMLGLMLI